MAKRMNDTPAAGGNIFTPATLALHRAVVTTKREADEAQGRYRAARKKLRDAGADMGAYALMESLAKLGEEEANRRMNDAMRYGRFLGLPIGTQLQLLEDDLPRVPEKAKAEHTEWEATEAGILAGKAGYGRVDDNPFQAGSPLYVAWDEGWLKGQATIAATMGENAKQANTSRKRREPAAGHA